MKTLTWADFAKHEPCYDPAEKYGEWEGTILDLMQHPEIPAKDKVWAFTRQGIVNDITLRLFAVGCARKVQHLMKGQRSIDALDVAERYANGNATKNELAAAWAAAQASARAAARAAEEQVDLQQATQWMHEQNRAARRGGHRTRQRVHKKTRTTHKRRHIR
jgi:hypothetical protein